MEHARTTCDMSSVRNKRHTKKDFHLWRSDQALISIVSDECVPSGQAQWTRSEQYTRNTQQVGYLGTICVAGSCHLSAMTRICAHSELIRSRKSVVNIIHYFVLLLLHFSISAQFVTIALGHDFPVRLHSRNTPPPIEPDLFTVRFERTAPSDIPWASTIGAK